MDKTYSPKDIEQARYSDWEKQHYFTPKGQGTPYCIMLPPPNVTGSLHMGHGFQHTLMDILVRYKRMMGNKTLWQPGTDHAGISTQLVVEGKLEAQGISRKEMAREEFLNCVWDWKQQSGDRITQQMRRIGSSIDWSRERFTMDKGFNLAVQKVFIQLYDEGLIYRGTRLVNWDPKLGTAVSDLEVISNEESGFMWHIRYNVIDSDEYIIVATTRPETLLADSAVAVHPEDLRYQHLIGKHLHLPLCDRTIPIIADYYVDQSFGTGCVKITPAHDFNDNIVGKRHQLPMMNILTKTATINENAPFKYQGMDRFVAREQIILDLTAQHLLVKIEPHVSKIPRGEKSNTIIEPLLSEQWYVKTKPLASPAIRAVQDGQVRFFPESWNKTYFQWMQNIEDWCISRQLWWGHRIPAWYDNRGRTYVGYSEADVRFKYKLDAAVALKQDEDVLDTWFSSALWPFVTLGWPERTTMLEQFYPTSVLITGFDILFFWICRMMMLGIKFTGKIPFKDVVVTGLVCDNDGKKMSKSKGNVLDPIDIIDGINLPDLLEKRTSHLMLQSLREPIIKATKLEFKDGIPALGTDALRFTYCSLPANSRAVRFDLERVAGYRNFCNKLWNAARFVLMSSQDEDSDFDDGAFQYSPADQWILSHLQQVTALCHQHIAQYRFDLLAQVLYEFIWHEYCDWYVEFAKTILYDDAALGAMKRGTRRTLIHVLEQSLKLLHPIIPFITEEIWLRMVKLTDDNIETLMYCEYPEVNSSLIYPGIEDEMSWVKQIIQAIRTIRSEMGISPATRIPLHIKNLTPELSSRLAQYKDTIIALSKLSHIHEQTESEPSPLAASSIVGSIELMIPMANLIDKNVELQRLDKALQKLEKNIAINTAKLNNPNFCSNAPQEVILALRAKQEQEVLSKEKLLIHREKILQLE